MCRLIRVLSRDEGGAILSAELVLILTLVVLGMIVGLSNLQSAVVAELNDVGSAIGSLNQSYYLHGHSGRSWWGGWGGGVKAWTAGSVFVDSADACDGGQVAITGPGVETPSVRRAPAAPVQSAPCVDCPAPATTAPCDPCEAESVHPGTRVEPTPDTHRSAEPMLPMLPGRPSGATSPADVKPPQPPSPPGTN